MNKWCFQLLMKKQERSMPVILKWKLEAWGQSSLAMLPNSWWNGGKCAFHKTTKEVEVSTRWKQMEEWVQKLSGIRNWCVCLLELGLERRSVWFSSMTWYTYNTSLLKVSAHSSIDGTQDDTILQRGQAVIADTSKTQEANG